MRLKSEPVMSSDKSNDMNFRNYFCVLFKNHCFIRIECVTIITGMTF